MYYITINIERSNIVRKIGYSKLKDLKKHLINDIKFIGEDAPMFVIIQTLENGDILYKGYETLSDMKPNEERTFPERNPGESITIMYACQLLNKL